MIRGSLISSRKQAHQPATRIDRPAADPEGARLLGTADANRFLGRAPGFLEKRRSSGVDSPPFIQTVKGGRVLYRTSDLLAWEESKLRDSNEYSS